MGARGAPPAADRRPGFPGRDRRVDRSAGSRGASCLAVGLRRSYGDSPPELGRRADRDDTARPPRCRSIRPTGIPAGRGRSKPRRHPRAGGAARLFPSHHSGDPLRHPGWRGGQRCARQEPPSGGDLRPACARDRAPARRWRPGGPLAERAARSVRGDRSAASASPASWNGWRSVWCGHLVPGSTWRRCHLRRSMRSGSGRRQRPDP